jgi:hypothetical protein
MKFNILISVRLSFYLFLTQYLFTSAILNKAVAMSMRNPNVTQLENNTLPPALSKYIVVDQFGYRPESRKTAVIRNPVIGYDSLEVYLPGSNYAIVDSENGKQVLKGTISEWNKGATDASSGDKAWWFDFSALKSAGKYFVLDIDSNRRSYEFEISDDIYLKVMVQAVRTFFYQRSGYAKKTPYAAPEWADDASHLQDKTARDFLKKSDATTQKDVSGGWYDAGDYNKYTSWTSNYVVEFMKAFTENPGVWGDDYNIPESGNKIPDILDEAKWGINHLLRLQQPNGSLLSVVGASHASPPSAAKGATYYGTPNTSGTLNAAAAFAFASKVYRSVGMKPFSDTLKNAALNAWKWANENPKVLYSNNTGNTAGLAAGQQETDDYGRSVAKIKAAVYLYEITGQVEFKLFIENNYNNVHLMQWTFAYPFETANQEVLLYYTTLPGISSSVKSNILGKYKTAMEGADNFAAYFMNKDPYLAHIKDYTWGSNSTKMSQGLMFTDYVFYKVNESRNQVAMEAAENFIHYLHGVNPLNLVYLSNMYRFGAENSVNEFYHSWFTNGSAKWDRVGKSIYGPVPGFLTGGPNPSYKPDGCCPSGCGSTSNNALCNSESISPPMRQPKQKSYKDFNTSWPLNSWEVTENSCGYQLNYIRLLAAFLPKKYDCSGILNGSASYDACGVCSGGLTGLNPGTNPANCTTSAFENDRLEIPFLYPNPGNDLLNIRFTRMNDYNVKISDSNGRLVYEADITGNCEINIRKLMPGNYWVRICTDINTWTGKFIKQ